MFRLRTLTLLAILGIVYLGTLIQHHQTDRNTRTLSTAPVVTRSGALRVAGHVTLDGAPLPGAQVRIVGIGVESRRIDRVVTSGSDGSFELGEVPLTWLQVTATAPDATFDTAFLSAYNDVDGPIRFDQLALDLRRCDTPMIGTVVDERGAALAGVQVGHDLIPLTTTGADGGFRLCAPAGVLLRFRADGKEGILVKTSSLPAAAPVRIELAPAAAIEGRLVRSDTGRPIVGAPVWVFWVSNAEPDHRGASSFSVSDADGRFRLDHLAAGTAWVRAEAPGLVADGEGQGHDVLTTVGETTRDVVIELTPGR